MVVNMKGTDFTAAFLNQWARDVRAELFKVLKNNSYGSGKEQGHFFADEEQAQTRGLINQCAGGVSLLLLSSAYDLPLAGNDLDDFDKLIADIIELVDKEGYNASPFIHANKTKEYFAPPDKGGKGFNYTDALSWVLSFAIQVRFYQRVNGILEDVNHPLNKKKTIIEDLIIDVLQKIYHASVKDKNNKKRYGWGFTNGCEKISLYFSFVISEVLGDYSDYLAGESPEIFKGLSIPPRDETLMKRIEDTKVDGESLADQIESLRFETGWWLYKTYGERLGEELIDPTGAFPNHHNNLYNNFFILEMLVVNNTDEIKQIEKFNRSKEEGLEPKEISERIRRCIEHGIYLTRTKFDKATLDTKYWEDAGASSHVIEWEDDPQNKKLQPLIDRKGGITLYEPGLIPLAIRCNANYCYYISQSKDPKMVQLFTLLRDDYQSNERKGIRLWDTNGFNLMLTERAIECLVDLNDYFDTYISDEKSKTVEERLTIEKLIRDIIKEELESQVKEEISDMIRKGDPFKEATGGILLGNINKAIAALQDKDPSAPKKEKSDKEKEEMRVAEKINKAMETWLLSLLKRDLKDRNKSASENMEEVKVFDGNFGDDMTSFLNIVSQQLYSSRCMLYNTVSAAIQKQLDAGSKEVK